MEISKTSKGKDCLIYNDKIYYLRRRGPNVGSLYWRCKDRSCNATAFTTEGQISKIPVIRGHHSCDHTKTMTKVHVFKANLKEKSKSDVDTPMPTLYKEELKKFVESNGLEEEAKEKLPKYVSMKTEMYRRRYSVVKTKSDDTTTKTGDTRNRIEDLTIRNNYTTARNDDTTTRNENLRTRNNDTRTKTDDNPRTEDNDMRTRNNDNTKTRNEDPIARPRDDDPRIGIDYLRTRNEDPITRNYDPRTGSDRKKARNEDLRTSIGDPKTEKNDVRTRNDDMRTRNNYIEARNGTYPMSDDIRRIMINDIIFQTLYGTMIGEKFS